MTEHSLNHVVTSTIVFEEDEVNEYVGGYDDWRAAVVRRESEQKVTKSKDSTDAREKSVKQQVDLTDESISKLSYMEKRELGAAA